MKLNLTFLALAFAGKSDKKCRACDDLISRFNDWHKNPNMVCDRYTSPKFIAKGNLRGASGWWHKTGEKLMNQYVDKAAELHQARLDLRAANKLEKELAKYNKQKKKIEEQKAKAENKAFKKADWEAWREDQRQKNEEARAQKKQEKKERKAAAKALKELKKEQRLAKRLLADQNKALFAFYASLEEHYEPVCPDLYLIEGIQNETVVARKYENFLRTLA
ncbi:Oidioi.mRNA.OKI2018_I69.XSR.g16512.t1.cds [Oikopleura dioica]|uniref:Oidioi.mRNA.OKI2018_I69.XSR.g16512.t1.cds n=1 Tax=Oikopleura dioica TaxID=34765 RepID=A0ABN7SQP4_OIKDI|nr:Oidioi.mRNA.OKI2018_I69.XSR.g16512.t1.cds [Oikopleura dioica]